MKIGTICFCLKDNKVLLAMKKRGFGAGKWNGYGGKVWPSEQLKIESSAIREIRGESRLRVKKSALIRVAIIEFYFDGKLVFKCHVFIVREFVGEPEETEEMGPHRWFSKLPKKMWRADRLWIPLILSGKKIEGRVDFNSDGSKVKKFSWKEVEFN